MSCINATIEDALTPNRDLKNRNAKGEKQGNSRLTKPEVIAIRRLGFAGVKNKIIATAFNILPSHVSGIQTGVIWKHLKES